MAPANPSALKLRIISALILAPLALAAVWAGGVAITFLVLAAVLGMGWEWARLCGRGRLGRTGAAIIATLLAAVGALALGSAAGLAIALVGTLGVAVTASVTREANPLWAAAGTLWIAAGSLAFLGVELAAGRSLTIWLLAVVWTSDIAAYAAGRTVGGPRLAPRISPNKSWAGFVGGLVGPAMLGAAAAPLLEGSPGFFAALAAALGLAAQLGDLAESFAKRHFGVKDSSGLIPGHGGLLDRLDGLLTAAVAFLAAIAVLPYF
ncbi:MAG TPA: phosphatidate cytidylyltransferase [Stellaceae bacterium]|nr:phosphatidate cytidylyltransferase [Stellaceae bacterium]